MTLLIKLKIIVAFVICLLCSAASVIACDCLRVSTEEAVKKSSVVFSGKVVGFEYRKGIPNWHMDLRAKENGEQIDYETLVVKVQVKQWWKGEAPTEIFLLTDSTKNADGTSSLSSCDFSFRQGESYLVFATGKENEYRASNCLRMQKLTQAEEDLKILGEGKKPIESKGEPNKPLDASGKQRLCYRVVF